MIVFEYFNNIFLKMTWLSDLVWLLVEKVFGLNTESQIAGILHFFIYDTIKIFILLCTLIFVISYIQSYFPPERTTKILQKYKGIKGNVLGALLGTLTPFCSCSSIPLFIGFTKAGLPVGITFSFLISSPLVDLASFLILASFLGLEIAIIYVVVGLLLAVIGGTIIDKAGMEAYIQDYIIEARNKALNGEITYEELSRKERAEFALDQVKDIIKKVWVYILIGVGIGAAIHNVIPESFIAAILGDNNPFGVILATGLGIPMYADIFGTIPIAEALLGKGVGTGTILAFMMSVTALSLPSMIMISKVVKRRLLITFISIVTIGILFIGFFFNAVTLFN